MLLNHFANQFKLYKVNTQPRLFRDAYAGFDSPQSPSPSISKLFDNNADVIYRGLSKAMSKETFERVLKEYQGVDVKESLCNFFVWFRDNGELHIGKSVEELVSEYLKTLK